MAAAEGLFLLADLGRPLSRTWRHQVRRRLCSNSANRQRGGSHLLRPSGGRRSGLTHSPTRRPPKLGWQITHLAETAAAASVITQMAGGHPGRADLLRRPSLINLGSLGEKTFALGKRRGLCPKVNIWYCSPNAPPRSNSGSSNTGTEHFPFSCEVLFK